MVTGILSANFSLIRWASHLRFAASGTGSVTLGREAHTQSQAKIHTESMLLLERFSGWLRHFVYGRLRTSTWGAEMVDDKAGTDISGKLALGQGNSLQFMRFYVLASQSSPL